MTGWGCNKMPMEGYIIGTHLPIQDFSDCQENHIYILYIYIHRGSRIHIFLQLPDFWTSELWTIRFLEGGEGARNTCLNTAPKEALSKASIYFMSNPDFLVAMDIRVIRGVQPNSRCSPVATPFLWRWWQISGWIMLRSYSQWEPPPKKKHARHWPLIVFHQPLRSPHAEKVTENNGNHSPRLVGGSSHAEEIWYNQIRSSSPALYNHCVGIPGSIPFLVGNPDLNLHFWLESWVEVRSKLVNTPCVGNHHPDHFQTLDKLSKLDLASNPRKLRSLKHSFLLPGSDHPKYLDPRSPWPPFLRAWFTGFIIS